jgi:glycosyltransferase involved in cell wall biosynthesis
MKILYTFGGIPPYLDALLNKLVQKGAETVVVIPKKSSPVLGKGVKVIDNPGDTAYKIIHTEEKTTFFGKSCFPLLPNIIRTEKPDILVTGWPFFLQFFFQRDLRKALEATHTKFVIREIPFRTPPYGKAFSFFREQRFFDEEMKRVNRGFLSMLKQWAIMRIRRYCYKKADGALVYASSGKDLLPTYGIAEDKVFVTYNSNDTDALFGIKTRLAEDNPDAVKNEFRIIHVGRLVKWKRVDLLIDAFSRIAASFPQAELVIIGDGPEMDRLRKQAADLNVEKKVIFTGAIYDSETIASHLSASAIYVLAGMGGLSINDAMTLGLPVICSVCDGTERDLVIDNRNGLFFDEGNVYDLKTKLLVLLQDPARASKMGEESWKIIRDEINLDTVSDRYIKAFEDILT